MRPEVSSAGTGGWCAFSRRCLKKQRLHFGVGQTPYRRAQLGGKEEEEEKEEQEKKKTNKKKNKKNKKNRHTTPEEATEKEPEETQPSKGRRRFKECGEMGHYAKCCPLIYPALANPRDAAARCKANQRAQYAAEQSGKSLVHKRQAKCCPSLD